MQRTREAIVIAAQRPEIRFVEAKTEEQQARAVLFQARERLVRQRTELVNARRAVMYEYGHVFPLWRPALNLNHQYPAALSALSGH